MNSHGAMSKGHRTALCALRSALCNPRFSAGFAYIALLVAIIIIGISLGAAGKYWSNVMLRDKEEELLFRGEEYRKAIEQYYNYLGRKQYPPHIDDLLKDSRSAVGRRHLRQEYKDPITGEDFVVLKNPQTRRIIGVRSFSDKLSLKQAGFPVTVMITGMPGIPAFLQESSSTGESSTAQDFNPTGDSRTPQTSSQTVATESAEFINETDDTELASTSTATIKYSDWLFISTIPAVQTRPVGTNQPLTNQTFTNINTFLRQHQTTTTR